MPTGHETDEILHKIFMPYADQCIEAKIKSKQRLVHYTTAAGALGILSTKSLWLRNALVMDDFSEVQTGFAELSKYFQDEKKRGRFSQAFDGVNSNTLRLAIERFDQWWGHVQTNTFLACFSEHAESEDAIGKLSMWRAFGKSETGVALVLRFPEKYAALPLKLMLRPVMYLDTPDRIEAELSQVVTNVESNYPFLNTLDPDRIVNALFYMLVLTTVTTKHQGFYEEREYRLCYFPLLNKSDFITDQTVTIHGIPQVVHKVPLENNTEQGIHGMSLNELLDRVIIGPSQYSLSIAQSLSRAMERAGVDKPDSKIAISNIPIRT